MEKSVIGTLLNSGNPYDSAASAGNQTWHQTGTGDQGCATGTGESNPAQHRLYQRLLPRQTPAMRTQARKKWNRLRSMAAVAPQMK